jgi:signal transduction histidine kinase
VQLTLFRIVQEALTNTLKHAGLSATAEVELTAGDADVRVSISDTGTSAPARANGNAGSGLRGMRERASIYGGDVQAGPRSQGGWLVSAQLPLAGPTEPERTE